MSSMRSRVVTGLEDRERRNALVGNNPELLCTRPRLSSEDADVNSDSACCSLTDHHLDAQPAACSRSYIET
jgi:hypothetical protein